MAQGYLRSMGMAEWTPKVSAPDAGKNKQNIASTPKPESRDAAMPKSRNNIIDDDLDFDFWLW